MFSDLTDTSAVSGPTVRPVECMRPDNNFNSRSSIVNRCLRPPYSQVTAAIGYSTMENAFHWPTLADPRRIFPLASREVGCADNPAFHRSRLLSRMDHAEYALMDAAEDRMWWYRALHARLLDNLAAVHGRVLDAGCGTGGFLALLRQRRPDLTGFGVEWDPTAASRTRDKSGAAVVRGSVNALPFASGGFDAAISADVLCHAAVDPAAALAELKRVLRPGGRLIVNMPAYQWLLSAHDRQVHNART